MKHLKRLIEWVLTRTRGEDQPPRSMFGADDKALEERGKANELEVERERRRGIVG